MRYEGYHELDTLPIKRGDRVRIKKGTRIYNVKTAFGVAKKTYVVLVDHILPGTDGFNPSNPSVRWPGPGSYWSEADINDVELLDK